MTQWQPQYDPDEHARRLDQGVAPQGYGQQRQQPPGQWPPPPQQPTYPPQYQQPQPPQYPPPGGGRRQQPRKRKGGALAAFLIGGTIAVIAVVAIAAAANSGKTPAPSASSPAAPPASAPVHSGPAAAAAAQTVTYVVTGSSADVTYGPAGSDLSGHVPLRKTAKLGNPAYYAISAQLQGGGKVTCEISVNGKVISKATATGGYNIAQCEVVQDPFGGGWRDANSA